MRLSDIKGEAALDVLAEIMEPVCEIAQDAEIVNKFRSGNKIKAIQAAIKEHKAAVIDILSLLSQKPREEYLQTMTLASLPMQALDILNDPELATLFTDAAETEKTSSTSAMENTEAKES